MPISSTPALAKLLWTATIWAVTGVSEFRPEAAGSLEQKQRSSSGEQVTPCAGIDIVGLRSAYNEDASVRLVIYHFASRQRNHNVMEVDPLVDALDRAGTPTLRDTATQAFRCLDSFGVGRFIPGRRGAQGARARVRRRRGASSTYRALSQCVDVLLTTARALQVDASSRESSGKALKSRPPNLAPATKAVITEKSVLHAES